jgi:hypothetical protein
MITPRIPRPESLATRNGRSRFARLKGSFLYAGRFLFVLFLAGGMALHEPALAAGEGPVQVAAAGTNAPDAVAVGRVNTTFIQNSGSCVLASYAVAASYFTGRPVQDYFEGYCRHFGLSFKDAADAERKYAAHFDAEWRKRDCRGYEVILDLHEHSSEKCFAEARRIFEGRFYLDSSTHIDELERLLKTREAFLNITYEPGRDYHSITVLHDETGFKARDTNLPELHPLPGLSKIGKLRDGVLYYRK